MFDSVTIKTGGDQYVTTTVTEKRAPTDESVRLLSEFEKKAEDKLISCVQVVNNTLSYNFRVSYDHELFDTKNVRIWFTLNGQDYDFTINLYRIMDSNEVPKFVYEKVIEKIAGKITFDLFEKCGKEIIRR